MNNPIFIFQTNGTYTGYVDNGYLYTRDGLFLGWVENDNNVYDRKGNYRGRLSLLGANYYILKNRFNLNPLPKPPTTSPPAHQPVPAQNSIPPVTPSLGLEDAFRVWGVS
jgi:hypothetical protein